MESFTRWCVVVHIVAVIWNVKRSLRKGLLYMDSIDMGRREKRLKCKNFPSSSSSKFTYLGTNHENEPGGRDAISLPHPTLLSLPSVLAVGEGDAGEGRMGTQNYCTFIFVPKKDLFSSRLRLFRRYYTESHWLPTKSVFCRFEYLPQCQQILQFSLNFTYM